MTDGDLVTRRGLRLPAAALDERFARGSGPGGQHRNVTASPVEIVGGPTELEGPGAPPVRPPPPSHPTLTGGTRGPARGQAPGRPTKAVSGLAVRRRLSEPAAGS